MQSVNYCEFSISAVQSQLIINFPRSAIFPIRTGSEQFISCKKCMFPIIYNSSSVVTTTMFSQRLSNFQAFTMYRCSEIIVLIAKHQSRALCSEYLYTQGNVCSSSGKGRPKKGVNEKWRGLF